MAIQQRTGDAKVKGVADVVFLFDCTGSMAPYIENVKDNVASLIKGFNGTPNVKLDWRVRAMGYKDFFVDKDCLINDFDFTDNADSFANNQLARLDADGGGDEKESALDAIWYALKKTTDLSEPFVVVEDTWTKGSDLISGTGELSVALDAGESQAFYRIEVSSVDPRGI